jgi:HTH-type transcriptional regulator/antitoxin HigA
MKKIVYSIVKSRKQYDEYCEIVESLTDNYKGENDDEIELLSYLIQKFNDEQTEKYLLNLNPVELLQDLLTENKISQKDLSTRIQVSPQLINDIIKYGREITKNIAYKLSIEFNMKFYSFLKPYEMGKAS